MIIKLMPDFPPLSHFIQALPTANNFGSKSQRYWIDRLPEEVAVVVQLFFSISFMKLRTDNSRTQSPERVYTQSLAKTLQYPLPPLFTISFVRGMLRVAGRQHRLTTLFLETYVNRVNALRPMQLVNPSHKLGNHVVAKDLEGRTYAPPQTGPASYVEELRVSPMLWPEQYLTTFTLHGAADMMNKAPCSTPWVADEISCI